MFQKNPQLEINSSLKIAVFPPIIKTYRLFQKFTNEKLPAAGLFLSAGRGFFCKVPPERRSFMKDQPLKRAIVLICVISFFSIGMAKRPANKTEIKGYIKDRVTQD